jgi:hypothetical protein
MGGTGGFSSKPALVYGKKYEKDTFYYAVAIGVSQTDRRQFSPASPPYPWTEAAK